MPKLAPIGKGSASSGISLKRVLPDSKFFGTDDVIVRSCCGKWDECHPNDLYVAIVGAEHDGHDFAFQAVKKGAGAILGERLLAVNSPQCIVEDSRHAYGVLCQILAGQPSQRLASIGVTGTHGKTVTSALIHSILKQAGYQSQLINSVENLKSDVQAGIVEWTAPWLADRLANAALTNHSHCVVEIPSTALAQYHSAGLELDVAVMTNIRKDQSGFHGSTRNYRNAKMRLLNHLKPSGIAILNADDPTTHFLLNKIDKPTLTVGVHQDAEVTGKILEQTVSEQTIMITAGQQSVVVRTSIIGRPHLYNCLIAAAAGLAQNIELETIARGLEAVKSVPGRMERIECGQPFGVFVDTSRSPNQLATALHTLKQVTSGRTICVASSHLDQSPAIRQQLGRIIERGSDVCAITGENATANSTFHTMHQILDGFNRAAKPQVIPNRIHAIEWALSQARAGDSVLIAGKGERPIATVDESRWQINDKDVCQAWLYDESNQESYETDGPTIYRLDDYRD
jgi:UDP-N-acetylmuramoyl-L-alanyl-D-glutamate--2,6-diaminopimelate ligase